MSKNRCFRLALSSKAGKNSVLLPTERFKCKDMCEEDMSMSSLICSMDVDCNKLLVCKMDMECMKTLQFDTEVSYGSELSNRGPTFDMDLSDFMDGEMPISYDKAKKYFAQDPSQKWAAYVAGTILVLMTELGVRFEDSISMLVHNDQKLKVNWGNCAKFLVSSAVPEGKGVSSSASVEVASMSAIAAAHGLSISPRDIALLCQKVENHIVGAPCGVMDQMTSACGEANKLLAMVCQPAEVIGLVEIPSHIRFWGIDSGIRHRSGIMELSNGC
ncbi:hypothetical protein DKX38_027604 [Salix brachista]|uniref:GHMP kinase N-terminal domain-containing protein n=1 Tax=Salix brachista TaxID=2182728 RepID=A0A5N5J3C1_9ROSI|nr:hypothetical protein DKX38_027604 [Salix brachista]